MNISTNHKAVAEFAAVIFFFSVSSCLAQTYKCKDSNGKTSYSDMACEYGAATVKLHDNTIDRTQAERSRDGEKIFESKVDDAKSNRRYADKCSFSSYAYSDEKGKILATAAKDECYKNEMLKEAGRGEQVSLDAYNLWKDHKIISKRTAPPPVPSLTCRPDGSGNMNCNPW